MLDREHTFLFDVKHWCVVLLRLSDLIHWRTLHDRGLTCGMEESVTLNDEVIISS